MSNTLFRHFLGTVLDAQRVGEEAWCMQSTGEELAVGLALNRPDWIARMDYKRVVAEWTRCCRGWRACGAMPRRQARNVEMRR